MSRCCVLCLALLSIFLLTAEALAQQGSDVPSPNVKPELLPGRPATQDNLAARQLSTNMAAIGHGERQVPPWSAGYAPYARSATVDAPRVVQSAVPAYPIGGFGVIPNSMGYGYALQGVADLTRAQGQYWNDIQSARLSREESYQKQIDTQRKRMEWEMEYERLRPTAPKMRAREREADLEWARNDPPNTEIWSGRSLNILLRSIFNSSTPTQGPRIDLDAHVLRGLNFTDKTTRGNLSLAKDEGKIDWTESLLEAPFDELRDRFSKNFEKAIKMVNYGEMPDRTLIRELQANWKALDEKLDDMVRDLPPSRYIESRRLLNRLNDSIRGLGNAQVVRGANQAWRKDIRTVSDLVGHMLRFGLEFGPAAAPGDEPAYTAAYYAIRNYERGIQAMASR